MSWITRLLGSFRKSKLEARKRSWMDAEFLRSPGLWTPRIGLMIW